MYMHIEEHIRDAAIDCPSTPAVMDLEEKNTGGGDVSSKLDLDPDVRVSVQRIDGYGRNTA